MQGARGDNPQCSNILVFFLQLEGRPIIERTELSTNHVLVYLEKVSIRLGRGWVRNTGIGTFGHIRKRSGTQNYHGSDKNRTESHTDFCRPFRLTGTFLPALSRPSLRPAQRSGPVLPTSQSLPQGGERPQGFPLPLSQACSPRTPQGPGPGGRGERGSLGTVWRHGGARGCAEPPLSLHRFPSPAEQRDPQLLLHGGAGHPRAGPEASSGEGL